MKHDFVETENTSAFHDALTALERRGAGEACLMVVDGQPGLGKTTTLRRWAVNSGAVYLRARKEWTPGWFLSDLLTELRITPAHSFQRRYGQAMEAMLARQSALLLQKQTFAIVIDEADHISRNGRIMESIRDFSDTGNIVFVLVGMGRIRDNLTAFPQVASRIAQYVRFGRSGVADVRKFFNVRCDVPVADCLVAFVHRVTDGYSREILEAIASVERFGRRNRASAEKPVHLADMAGETIVNDRRSGHPVIIPQVV